MSLRTATGFDEEILNAIVRVSSEAVWVNDYLENEQYWLASPSNVERYLLPATRRNPDFWMNNIHPDDKYCAMQGYQGALDNSSVTFFEHEYRFKGRDGYHIIHDKMEFFRDDAGKVYRVVGVWNDISEKRRKEKQLNELFEKMRNEHEQSQIIAKLTNSVLWKISFHDNRIYWTAGNDSLEQYALEPEGYTLSYWTHTIHPDDRERVVRTFNETLHSNDLKYCEQYRFVHSGGKIAYLVLRGYIVRGADGKPIEMLGGWTDITMEVELEQALRKALDDQQKLNREVSVREEELANSEEELRQVNEHLLNSLHTLEERELQLRESYHQTQEAHRKIGEYKLIALRSAMNPHFIFNALNSIQFFIAKNKREDAINYLSTFSKLIRGILTSSVKNNVLLSDELGMLRYYIQLEQVRFENKFVFELNISPDVDPEQIEIPSLLIQPFVENAILHGLYNKKEEGKLTISIEEENERLLIMITDDGIGREAARELQKKGLEKHESMGSLLAEQRLKLINQEANVYLEILDNKDKNNKPTGTTVKIWLDNLH